MSPEAQRIAIGEACGWRFVPGNAHTMQSDAWEKDDGSWYTELPDYLNDLNAMRDAELKLVVGDDNTLWPEFTYNLGVVMGCPISFASLIHASAPQRAEAILKTLNIWTE